MILKLSFGYLNTNAVALVRNRPEEDGQPVIEVHFYAGKPAPFHLLGGDAEAVAAYFDIASTRRGTHSERLEAHNEMLDSVTSMIRRQRHPQLSADAGSHQRSA